MKAIIGKNVYPSMFIVEEILEINDLNIQRKNLVGGKQSI